MSPGGQLARTSSADLARQLSVEERKQRQVALASHVVDEAEERAASIQLEAVQCELENMQATKTATPTRATRLPGVRSTPARSISMGNILAPALGFRQLARSVSAVTPPSSRAPDQFDVRPMEERAVTVEWLISFANRHNAWSMKTWEVVEKIIKPLTHSFRCRFCELEGEIPDGVLGLADSFLSHCWGNEFGDLVSAARHNARPGRRYWVDIFAVNQHMSSETDKRSVKFKLSRASGKVLANQPVALNEQGQFVPQFEDDLRRLNHVVVSLLRPHGGILLPLFLYAQPAAFSFPVWIDTLSLCCELQRSATQGTTLVLCPRKSMNDKYRNPFQRIWCVEEIRETLSAQQPLVIKCGAAAGPQHIFREEWDHSVTNELVLSVNVEEAVNNALTTSVSVSHRREVRPSGANCFLFCGRRMQEASVPSDRDMILQKIKAIGFDRVNKQVNMNAALIFHFNW
jgi:hypothetical protein